MDRSEWKAIILAGGSGTRLHPLTRSVNKHLLPVFDKPMIYYPLSTLMLGGLKDYVIISTPEALPHFQALLGDGNCWGLNIEYREQAEPRGIAECFLIAEDLIEGKNTALILGDNIFYSDELGEKVQRGMDANNGATIFGYEVADPTAFGVINLDVDGRPVSIDEKPKKPKSNLAVPGLYLYDKRVLEYAKSLKPSARGEMEITDINRRYLDDGELTVLRFGRGTAWLDGGTHEALYAAGQFIKVVEDRTGLKIGCPEEIAFRKGFISGDQLAELAEQGSKSDYDSYVRVLVDRLTRAVMPKR